MIYVSYGSQKKKLRSAGDSCTKGSQPAFFLMATRGQNLRHQTDFQSYRSLEVSWCDSWLSHPFWIRLNKMLGWLNIQKWPECKKGGLPNICTVSLSDPILKMGVVILFIQPMILTPFYIHSDWNLLEKEAEVAAAQNKSCSLTLLIYTIHRY